MILDTGGQWIRPNHLLLDPWVLGSLVFYLHLDQPTFSTFQLSHAASLGRYRLFPIGRDESPEGFPFSVTAALHSPDGFALLLVGPIEPVVWFRTRPITMPRGGGVSPGTTRYLF